MLRCNRANVNEGLLRGLCDNSSRVIAIIRDRLEAPRQGIEPCYAGLESAFLPEAKACEQFQHVLRCDHLAGPKPITLMEPLFIRLERQHLSDTVSRIWFVYERVTSLLAHKLPPRPTVERSHQPLTAPSRVAM